MAPLGPEGLSEWDGIHAHDGLEAGVAEARLLGNSAMYVLTFTRIV